MKKLYLGISILLLVLSIPFCYLKFYIIVLLFLIISLISMIKYKSFEENILNNKCNPKEFFDRNKDNKKEIVNNCIALFDMFDGQDNILIKEYVNEAIEYYDHCFTINFSNKKMKDRMRLDYIKCCLSARENDKIVAEKLFNSFSENWLTNVFLPIEVQRFSKDYHFNYPKEIKSKRDLVIKYYNMGIVFYENKNYQCAYENFNFVKENGNTMYCVIESEKYLKELEQYDLNKDEKNFKTEIKIHNKYLFYKSYIDFFVPIYSLILCTLYLYF